MIATNFVYARPDTEAEAVQAFAAFREQGITPLYYAGGSEIITMATAGSIQPGAVIDIKRIPAMNIMETKDGYLTIGGAVTLTTIRDSGCFPLLGTTVGRIADHTNQCRITLGGNLCGTILYREAALPLLVADAEVSLYGPDGPRRAPLADVFDGRVIRDQAELLIQVHVPEGMITAPFAHIKKTTGEKIGYPAVTAVTLVQGDRTRYAFSGICHSPLRSAEMENALNAGGIVAQRVENAVRCLPSQPITDSEGSGAYRLQILRTVLTQLLEGETR